MKISPVNWFVSIIAIIVITDISCLLDIPVLRQISGFIFLAFLPGFLILLVLRLNRLGLTEKLVLSVGLSVAFTMFFGIIMNSFLVNIGYDRPLSIGSLLISFGLVVFILAIIAFYRNRDDTISFSALRMTAKEKVFLIVPSLFPVLSIAGTHVMNLNDNNIILMVLLLLIPAYVIFVSFYRHKFPEKSYISLILLISVSILLILALRTNHITGSDIHEWYYNYQITLDNLHWSILGHGILDACLSISLLPAIYQVFLNINTEYLFKILYPLLFSISPLMVYIISKKYVGSFYAFLASFTFMSQYVFYWTAGTSNTSTAILFFGLTIMVMFHDGIGGVAKKLLAIIFAASCIVSHYSTTYVFFFVLLLTWIGMLIIPRILYREKKVATSPENANVEKATSSSSSNEVSSESDGDTPQPAEPNIRPSRYKRNITFTFTALFLVTLFLWYSQITQGAFNVGLGVIRRTILALNQWFLLEARGTTVTAAMGENINTIPQQIRLIVSWSIIAFIAIGVLITWVRYKKMVAMPRSRHTKPDFLNVKFETEFLTLSLACSAAVAFSVLMPYISVSYSTERVYFQALTVLSLFFVIGGIMVAKWVRARPHWLILLVLIPFFMCITGSMYQIFRIPASIALNSEGREYEQWVVYDQESYAAKWLKVHRAESGKIYTNYRTPQLLLASQGKIPPSFDSYIIPHYEKGKEIDGYIYLRQLDIQRYQLTSEYPGLFAGRDKIYVSNGSEIYQ